MNFNLNTLARTRTTTLLLLALLFLIGCRDTTIEDGVAALNSSKIKQLYNCYALYGQNNGYRGPKDKEELVEFLLRPNYERNLKLMQIDRDNLEQLFINDRDGEPFKIRWGVNGWGDKAVIFEAVGVDGKRMVSLIESREVDESEYKSLWSGKSKIKTVMPDQTVDESPTAIK